MNSQATLGEAQMRLALPEVCKFQSSPCNTILNAIDKITKNVSFELPYLDKNSIYVIGPQGSGKTTFIEFLLCRKNLKQEISHMKKIEKIGIQKACPNVRYDRESGLIFFQVSNIAQNGITNKLIQGFINNELQERIFQYRILILLPFPEFIESKGETLIDYLNQLSNTFFENDCFDNIVVAFSRSSNIDEEDLIIKLQELLDIEIGIEKKRLNIVGKSILEKIIQKNRIILFKKIQFSSQAENPEGGSEDIFQAKAIKKILSAKSLNIKKKNLVKTGSALQKKLFTSMLMSYEKNMKYQILNSIKEKFLTLLDNYSEYEKIEQFVTKVEHFSLTSSREVQKQKLESFYQNIGFSKVEVDKKMRFVTNLNRLLGNKTFKIYYGDLSQLFLKLKIKEVLKEISIEYSSDKSQITVSGFRIKPYQFPLAEYINKIKVRSLYLTQFIKEIQYFYKKASIISPFWSIKNNSQFRLYGQIGKQEFNTIPSSGYNAGKSNGWRQQGPKGGNGGNGLPGNPGQNGGNFVGLGEKVEGSHRLKITSIGAPGGRGQTGGNGGVGGQGGDSYKTEYISGPQFNTRPPPQIIQRVIPFNNKQYNAGKGGNGGDSGNPGQGGQGGNPGIIQLMFPQKNQFGVTLMKGPKGQNGPLGFPGQGGRGGKVFIALFYGVYQNYLDTMYPGDNFKGQTGHQSANFVGPAEKPKQSEPSGYEVVIDYENYLVSLLHKQTIQADISYRNFLKFIGTDYSSYISNKNQKYSKLGVKHLITQANMLFQIYKNYLYQKNRLSTQQIIKLYQAFSIKLQEVANNQLDKMSQNETQILFRIVTNTHLALKSLKMSYTVLNFEYIEYFYNSKSISYTNIINQKRSLLEKKTYLQNIQSKINIAKNLAGSLQHQIEVITKKIDKGIQVLKKQLQQAKINKQKYAEELKKAMGFKVAGNILSLFGDVASFFGPKGQAVNSLLKSTKSLLGVLSPSPSLLQKKELNPSTYLNMDNGLEKILAYETVDKATRISSKIPTRNQIISYIDNGNRSGLINVINKIDLELEDQLKRQSSGNEKKNLDKYEKLSVASKGLKSIQIAMNVAETIKQSKEFIDQVEKAQKNLKQFKQTKEELISVLDRNLKNLIQKMRDINSSFSNTSSKANIIFLQYGFRSCINDLLSYISNSLKNFEYAGKDDLLYLFNKLDFATQKLSQTYSQVQNYKSQAQLVNLIVNTSSKNLVVGESYQGFKEMEKNFQELIILKEGNNLLNSIKQLTFPVLPYYSYKTYEQIFSQNNLSVTVILEKLRQAYRQIKLSKYAIGSKRQNYLVFDDDVTFCTYKNKQLITNLLKGNQVVFFPDITKSKNNYDSLKFNSINIRIGLEGHKLQNQLENLLLENYQVQMTSSGNYYYRFNGTYYNLPSSSVYIFQAYNPKKKKENQTIITIEKSDPIFSPFTTWTIRLRSSKSTFNLIEKFGPFLDNAIISLYGSCCYIDPTLNNQQGYQDIIIDPCFNQFQTEIPLTL